ncbi:MAG: UDP-N-acetylmuramoyl-L-alanine--D-glutamate ligase [Chitinophagales bacterium]|jgi:UDP-N-acetylmuramoylalanine--D-glutamate ligase|nr:UDP-N-acetylmuramoyl-L-alanine--D-glutamate ligase [Chitinophagales bacterium]
MNQRIVILGSGESGFGAAYLAKAKGYSVFVSDFGQIATHYKNLLEENQIEYEEKQHTLPRILQSDLIIKSPGIPENSSIIKEIRKIDIPIVSEIEFAYRYIQGKIIGITGSNGKTTTTSLIYHIFKSEGMSVALVGNIGHSLAYQIATDPKDFYILELSSFQLDDIVEFRCDIAILLNISEDHLDRYDYKMENYIRSKFNIIKNKQDQDLFIYNADDEHIVEFINKNSLNLNNALAFTISEDTTKAGYFQKQELKINTPNHLNLFSMNQDELVIKGKHNVYNSLASGIAARCSGIKDSTIRESFMTFRNMPHRMELVQSIHGVKYINDSKATNVNSAWYALESVTGPVIWIAGGIDKGNQYDILKPLVKEKVKAMICLGKDNIKLNQEFNEIVDVIVNVQSMKDAVKIAYKMAQKGDSVLLSPACSSFDLFQNYEDRGQQFIDMVRNL